MQTKVTTLTYLNVQRAKDLGDNLHVSLVMVNTCFHEQRLRSMACLMTLAQGLRLSLQGDCDWGFRRYCYRYH